MCAYARYQRFILDEWDYKQPTKSSRTVLVNVHHLTKNPHDIDNILEDKVTAAQIRSEHCFSAAM
jgi:hypothetical protein